MVYHPSCGQPEALGEECFAGALRKKWKGNNWTCNARSWKHKQCMGQMSAVNFQVLKACALHTTVSSMMGTKKKTKFTRGHWQWMLCNGGHSQKLAKIALIIVHSSLLCSLFTVKETHWPTTHTIKFRWFYMPRQTSTQIGIKLAPRQHYQQYIIPPYTYTNTGFCSMTDTCSRTSGSSQSYLGT